MGDMEHKTGKRVLPSKGPSLGGKIGIAVVATLLALVIGGYFGLCAYVGSSSVILPNTTAAGVPLGGLSRDQARAKLSRETAARFAKQSISFSYPGGTAEVNGSSVEIDAEAVTQAAYRLGRENGFLGGGAAYLVAVFGGTDVEAPVRFSQAGEQGVDDMVANIEDHLTQGVEQTTYKLEENTLTLVKGVSGMSVDIQRIKTDILQAVASGGEGGPSFAIEPQITAPDEPDFNAIYQEIYTVEADAYLDKVTKEIVPSVTGISFDIATAQALLERTDEGAVCRVPLNKTEPDMTTEKLTENLFKDVLGSTRTKAAGPSQRWHNIKLAAGFINDTILLPGEVFSYNAACEPYTKEHGYQNAGTYQNGKSVDATAGGICQLSSTLYWATLEANLETVERSKHAFNTGYLPIVGTDATVFSGSPDFKFKNDTEYPIKITAYMDENHYVHVTISGTSNGIHGEPFNKTISTKPAGIKYVPKASVPQGSKPQKDPEQYAISGITVEVYLRLVDADGNTVETKFLHKNTYAMRDAVYFYNPADAALWGIDAEGRQTLTPLPPTPTPTPSPDPTVDPGATEQPTTSPTPTPSTGTEPGVSPSPSETPPPGIPIDPVESPVPVE